MHKDGEARTKGDVESREIKGSTEKAEQTYIYLFIYRTAGLGPRLRTVITHYQQRRRAVITGRRVWCKASRGANEVAQHKTVQTSNGILWRAKVKAVNAPETSAIIRITCLFQVNLKMVMNLKRSACVESLQRNTFGQNVHFVSVKQGHFFCLCLCELLGAPPRRHTSPAWQRFNFTILKTPLFFPWQGFNPDVLPTVFKSQHSHFDVVAQGEICGNILDYQDTSGVPLRPLRSERLMHR